MKNKILFIKGSTFEAVNDSIAKMLAVAFPGYELVQVDIAHDLLGGRRSIYGFLNLLFIFKEYGLKAFLSKKTLRRYFFRTPYIFNQIQKLMAKRFGQRSDIAFSFQVHSMFNTKLEGIPYYVYTDRSHLANLQNPEFKPRQLFSKQWIVCERTIYAQATIVFTRSTNISKSLVEQYSCPPEKVRCVYAGGTTPQELAQDNSEKYKSENILFVGRNWELKGGPELVKAFKAILPEYPKATLTIVGCSPKLDHSNINIVGPLEPMNIASYYQQAAIFCLPTRTEAFGMAFVEALQYMLPIIGTNIEAIPDMIEEGHNGYLVPVKDSSAIAIALEKLLGDTNKCKEFGEHSYQLAQTRYTWEAVGKAIRISIEEKVPTL